MILNFTNFEQMLIDLIKEEQVKLGYRSEAIRFYFPLDSLNHSFNTQFSAGEMTAALTETLAAYEGGLGPIQVSCRKDRFEFRLTNTATDYVHANTPSTGFIYDFIEVIARHGISMDEVLQVFRRFSDKVHVERVDYDDFDYIVYFEDGVPDSYIYCMSEEGHHIIYHRFTKTDFEAYHFS